MKTKIKKVYYCDYCKKHALRPLTEHEKHCTANPNRWCRLCDNNYSDTLPELIEQFQSKISFDKDTGEAFCPKAIDILDAVGGCPNCAFTIMRCTGMNRFPFDTGFKYKEELEKWWDIVNNENYERIQSEDIPY